MTKFLIIVGWVIIWLILVGLLCAWPLQLLWNWLMTDLFGLARISFWQAWGLFILSGLLFKSSNSSKSD